MTLDRAAADVVTDLAHQAKRIANAITSDAAPGHDAAGGTVGSLTEAVMGLTAGLMAIADAIGDLADAFRESREDG